MKVYIIDSGILYQHAEFGGRAVFGFDAFSQSNAGTDCNGHGTHVAGTVGGATYGVAKQVTLVAVRVLRCDQYGAWSDIIAGVDWVTQDHQPGSPAVANMSLGTDSVGTAEHSDSAQMLEDAIRGSIADGITYVAAAGNGTNFFHVPEDACTTSPARMAEVITVGGSDSTDHQYTSGNYGPCLDLYAPGVNITSAYIDQGPVYAPPGGPAPNYVATLSGTSMAAPHVAGVAANYLQYHPNATPSAVSAALLSSATTGAVVDPGTGSPNRLVFSSVTDPAALTIVTPSPLPTASAQSSYTVQFGASGGYGTRIWSSTSLPNGLTMNSGGLLSGSPVTAGSYSFVVTVTDLTGGANKSFSLEVAPATSPLTVGIEGFTSIFRSEQCMYYANVSGGTTPYSYAWYRTPLGGTEGANPVSTGSNYNAVPPHGGGFTLRLVVTGGGTAQGTLQVSSNSPTYSGCNS